MQSRKNTMSHKMETNKVFLKELWRPVGIYNHMQLLIIPGAD
jgi:hypothetical protein